MGALIDEVTAQGEQFWKTAEVEESGSEDDSFEEEEVKPDEFDSDFNDSEDSDEEADDDEKPSKRSKVSDEPNSKSHNKYKEPTKVIKKPVTKTPKKQISSSLSDKQDDDFGDSLIDNTPRLIRASTKQKSQEAHEATEILKARPKPKIRPQIRHQFTQKQLLDDALKTEVVNAKWLQSQKLAEDERSALAKPVKKQVDRIKRTLSRRGAYTTITFSEVEDMPRILTEHTEPTVPNKVCVITGLPAKYRDPKTGHPFANLDAYRQLKRMYHDKQPSHVLGGPSSSRQQKAVTTSS